MSHNESKQTPDGSRPSPEEQALWNSGRYRPPSAEDSAPLEAELDVVRSYELDVQLEEFPEGPYGSARNEENLGKSTTWRAGQAVVSSHRDQNPDFSDRKLVVDSPEADAPIGSIEGQN